MQPGYGGYGDSEYEDNVIDVDDEYYENTYQRLSRPVHRTRSISSCDYGSDNEQIMFADDKSDNYTYNNNDIRDKSASGQRRSTNDRIIRPRDMSRGDSGYEEYEMLLILVLSLY